VPEKGQFCVGFAFGRSKFKVQSSKFKVMAQQLRSVNSPERSLTARGISNLPGLFAM